MQKIDLSSMFDSSQPKRGRPSLSADEKLARAEALAREVRIMNHPSLAPVNAYAAEVKRVSSLLATADERIASLRAEILQLETISENAESIEKAQDFLRAVMAVNLHAGTEEAVVSNILSRFNAGENKND